MRSIDFIRIEDTRPWICAMLLIVIAYPMWLWNSSPNIIVWASLVLLIVAYKDIRHNKRTWNAGLLVFFIQIVFLGRYYILPDTNLNGFIMILIRGAGYATIFLCSIDFWKRTTDCFIKLLALLLIPALVEHIMTAFVGTPLVESYYIEECPINPDREYDAYLLNAYMVKTIDLAGGLRFMAFFDEPGVLGNIAMVLLYIQKFNLKKWYNIVLMIAGILSFSLAFYLTVAAYYIIFGDNKVKLSFIFVVLVATFYFINNDDIYELVFGRLEFENGSFSGYNREIHSDLGSWIKRVSIVDFLFWGYSPRQAIPYAASWRWAFVLYGIIPSLIYLSALIFPRYKLIRNKKDILIGLVLVIVIWIQRPFLQLYLYVFLLAIPFIYFSDTSKRGIRRINIAQQNE